MSDKLFTDITGRQLAIGQQVTYPVRSDFGGDPKLATGTVIELTVEPFRSITADYARVRGDEESLFPDKIRVADTVIVDR